MFNKLIEHNLS